MANLKLRVGKLKPLNPISISLFFFILTFLLNLIAVKWGFPLLTHPDEHLIINPVIRMTAERSLDPQSFVRPDLFTIHLLHAYLNLASYIRYGVSASEAIKIDNTFLHLHGRILISFLGAFIPLFAFEIGKLLKKPKLGIIFAILCMLYPSFLINARYISADVPITALTMACIYFSIKYLVKNQMKYLIFAVILAAISMLEKYSSLITTSAIILALLVQYINAKGLTTKDKIAGFSKEGLLMFGVFMLSLIIFGYSLLDNIPEVLASLKVETRSSHVGADGLGFFGNLKFYAELFEQLTNPFIWVMIPIGIFALIKQKCSTALILLVGIVNWITLSAFGLHWERWSLPMVITPLFFSATGINFLLEKIKQPLALKWIWRLVVVIGLGVYTINGLYYAVRTAWPDTRSLALQYTKDNGINPENTLFEGYTPFLPGNPLFIFGDYSGKELIDKDYIILSSQNSARFYNESARYSKEVAYLELLKSKSILLKEFKSNVDHLSILGKVTMVWEYLWWNKGRSESPSYNSGNHIEIYQINR